MYSPRHRTLEVRPAARALAGRIVGPAVVSTSLTAMVVAVGVAGSGASHEALTAAPSAADGARASLSGATLKALEDSRTPAVSRSAKRVTMQPKVTGHQFATSDLNVWTGPGEKTRRVGLIDAGTKLAVTGKTVGHWAEVVLKGEKVRWVNADYLADKKPAASAAAVAGLSSAPCPDGSGTESGLTSAAVALYRAACAAFPALSSYGGYDGHGEHASGKAIDFMVSDPALGSALAEWARAHAAELHLYDVIWQQHIWTPERASEGWRAMSDRGSATANHYDHVHISVY